ncbi:ParB/RepB/Spo0J family partition protein [Acidovorax sp. BLS4]|uniref:ParB/RepB/Spo0J family partition protein n=1 Tax=Acidovorax sp. BLS4 TaxID=3273430 RepID=UPI002941D6D1|nr:ParB/RepB/Spo0J family partition protein [Paracidovorax avenae]WOI43758.1 ParB/RepB/Spo0J family partition protein [Paracidovorax avenae]
MATDQHDNATAILPAPGAGPQMRMVEVALIEESLTNPRKHFNQEKLGELADSIRASGVHQPILLRPLPGTRLADTFGYRRQGAPLPAYELVAGARRLRACKIAKVHEVPAMIRELTDDQALEIQVIENLQREDVTELEEAEGYEVLMRTGKITAEEVGAKIGKSRSYVYGRLKVLDLCHQAREALREGKIDFSKGLLIARIPDEGLQLKALDFCLGNRGYYGSDGPGYRECANYVQQNYMLKLGSAKFKITDANLIPKAGSCKECPKRTGANPDLFQDVDSADVCTDPTCYRAKEDAHSVAVKKAALESGAQIIEGREAKALMPNSWNNEVKGYLRLDDKNDSPTDKPLRKLIGKAMEQQGIKPTLVANPHKGGELVAVITADQAEVLLKAANQGEAAAKIEQEAQRDAELQKRQAAASAKNDYEEQWRWDLLAATWAEISGGSHEAPADAVLRHIATDMAKALNQDRARKLCKLLDLGKVAPVQGLVQYIADTDAPGDALQLMVMFQDVEYRHWLEAAETNKGLLMVAEDFGVDVNGVKAKTKANQREAAKAKADREAAKAAAPKGASTPPPAAQATTTRAKSKAQKTPAARATDTGPKTSKAHASAQIAEALADLEGNDQAPAAQGDEAPAVADAQPVASAAPAASDKERPTLKDKAPAAQGIDAAPVADAQAPAAPVGQGGADVSNGAAASKPVRASFPRGAIVRVKEGLKGPGGKLRKCCGRVGVVESGGTQLTLRFGPRRDEIVIIPAGDVEPYKADPIIGKRVRVLQAGLTPRRKELLWSFGSVKACRDDGWEIAFHSKTGGVPRHEIFGTEELESIE